MMKSYNVFSVNMDYFVDDFGDATDRWYVYNNIPMITKGIGNNMAGLARVIVSDVSVSIELYEDFNVINGSGTKVVNTTYQDQTYKVSIKAGNGDKYSYTGTLYSGEDNIFVALAVLNSLENSEREKYARNAEIYEILCDVFSAGGEIQFVITPTNNPNKKYSFTIDPITDFLNQYPIVGEGSFSQGLATVKKLKCGYINTDGNVVIPYEWDDARAFSEGLAAVEKNGKWGFINQDGRLVIPCEWDSATQFADGLGWVRKNKKEGFINKDGKLVIPCEWDMAYSFREERAVVEKYNKRGFIDTNGKLVIPCEWDDAYGFSNGLAYVKKGNKGCFIDKNGKTVIVSTWDTCSNFSEGMCYVNKNGKYGFIDTTGKLIIPYEWDRATDFRNGIAAVKKSDNWYLINKNGTVITEVGKWNYVNAFSDGLARVVVFGNNDKEGYIDETGNLVIPCVWSNVNGFSEGLACVEKNTQYYYINKNGNVIFPVE